VIGCPAGGVRRDRQGHPLPAELAVMAVDQNDPATLSFSDWELILSYRDASLANRGAADRVWKAIQEKQKNGAARLKIPVKVISVDRNNHRSADNRLRLRSGSRRHAGEYRPSLAGARLSCHGVGDLAGAQPLGRRRHAGSFRTTIVACAAVLAVGLSLAGSSLAAKGRLDSIAKFRNGNLELHVDTYFDPEQPAGDNKAGLLSIRSPPLQNSFAFDFFETKTLIGLWTKATKAQSATWKAVGTMTETGTKDVSVLNVSAGPGVRLVITSPEKGAVTYNLAAGDMAQFEKALHAVRDFLSK
jgi:hypothetical protein